MAFTAYIRQPAVKSATLLSLTMDWLTSVSVCQAYVFDGDIYYKPSVTSNALRLTSTNQEQNVVNGLSDWIYEGRSPVLLSGQLWAVQADPQNKMSVFKTRGGAFDICCPLVVSGRCQAGLPPHQQLCYTCDGVTSLPGWHLSLQHHLPLPKGKLTVKATFRLLGQCMMFYYS